MYCTIIYSKIDMVGSGIDINSFGHAKSCRDLFAIEKRLVTMMDPPLWTRNHTALFKSIPLKSIRYDGTQSTNLFRFYRCLSIRLD